MDLTLNKMKSNFSFLDSIQINYSLFRKHESNMRANNSVLHFSFHSVFCFSIHYVMRESIYLCFVFPDLQFNSCCLFMKMVLFLLFLLFHHLFLIPIHNIDGQQHNLRKEMKSLSTLNVQLSQHLSGTDPIPFPSSFSFPLSPSSQLRNTLMNN
jgi:hypothetical protein